MKQLCVFVLAALVYAGSAYAEEHFIRYDDFRIQGELGFARLSYEYDRDSSREVGVRIDLHTSAVYNPTSGVFRTTRGSEFDTRDVYFHSVVPNSGPQPFLSEPDGHEGSYTMHFLKGAGLYNFEVIFTDGESKTYVNFSQYFSTFDATEHICRVGRKHIALDFTFWSMEDLPDSVDLIDIELGNGETIELENIPFVGSFDGFGWINVPMKKKTYKRQLAGKEFLTHFVVAGEIVTKVITYPSAEETDTTCTRG